MNKSLITALKAIGIAAASCAAIFVLLVAASLPQAFYDAEQSVQPALIQTVKSDTPMNSIRLIKYKDVTIQQFDSLLQEGLTENIETEVVRTVSDVEPFNEVKFFPQYRGVYLIQSLSDGGQNGSVLMYFDEARVNGLIEKGLTVEHVDGYFTTTLEGAINITKDFQVVM